MAEWSAYPTCSTCGHTGQVQAGWCIARNGEKACDCLCTADPTVQAWMEVVDTLRRGT